jgi:MEMO1 family protein
MREAVVAGSFYPSEKKELKKMVDGFLEKTKNMAFKGKIVAAIVPHAGYIYSGEVAAKAYSEIKKTKPKKIILLGPSHQEYLDGAYSFNENWKTPLGEVKVTPAHLPIVKNDSEHSLEVQLPFLQSVLKDFELTPIIYGNIDEEDLAEIVEKENGFILVSSDLSHYLPYDNANKVDKNTIKKILDLNTNGLSEEGDACGIIGIMALVILANKKGWKAILLDYKNSGDILGDKKGVVGYASIIFIE